MHVWFRSKISTRNLSTLVVEGFLIGLSVLSQNRAMFGNSNHDQRQNANENFSDNPGHNIWAIFCVSVQV